MIKFKEISDAVDVQIHEMGNMFTVGANKDELWNLYLDSFPEGENKIYKTNREYDCNCCKRWMRVMGDVVAIVNGKVISVWDKGNDPVSKALSVFVKSHTIKDVFLHNENDVGVDFNFDKELNRWDHYHIRLPNRFISDNVASDKGKARANKDVIFRGLNELTTDSVMTVLELIEANSLYRGEEYKPVLDGFLKLKLQYIHEQDKDVFCWANHNAKGARIRNSAIGTLLIDLSDNIPVEKAVERFETVIMAPTNFKRSRKLVTKGMIDKAQARIKELGLEDSLARRYAVLEDINVNDVLWVDRSVSKQMQGDLFEQMKADVADNVKVTLDIPIAAFMECILPNATSIELMMENKHSANLMTLIAPTKECKPIFSWDNNFSWSYKGNVADSMKENVKKAGGNIDAIQRFSIQWNDNGDNLDDLDAHCIEPDGNEIYYNSMKSDIGHLDVDVIQPEGVAVENIVHTRVHEGKFQYYVHCYSSRGATSGFTAEFEFKGKIYTYSYDKPLRQGDTIGVLTVNIIDGEAQIEHLLSHEASIRDYWNIKTNKFIPVHVMMYSPNHWNQQRSGNRHYFFFPKGCKSDATPRGIYNEFLRPELTEDRKVFEVLGTKIKVEGDADNQLSGLGFSTTIRNSMVVRVNNKKQYKLEF